jgi:hypothetical protein
MQCNTLMLYDTPMLYDTTVLYSASASHQRRRPSYIDRVIQHGQASGVSAWGIAGSRAIPGMPYPVPASPYVACFPNCRVPGFPVCHTYVPGARSSQGVTRSVQQGVKIGNVIQHPGSNRVPGGCSRRYTPRRHPGGPGRAQREDSARDIACIYHILLYFICTY